MLWFVTMNSVNLTSLNSTYGAEHSYQYSMPDYDPTYKDYMPLQRELFPLPKAVLYLLMAALVLVAIAYAIVGHLIKDVAHDVADCVLGPDEEDRAKELELQCISTAHIPTTVPNSRSNGFHAWEPDDVAIRLSPEESQQGSPQLLTTTTYFPSSLPRHKGATSSNGQEVPRFTLVQDLESDIG